MTARPEGAAAGWQRITTARVILGLYQGYNANVCVLVDGQPIVVVEKERQTRVRHAYGPSPESVHDCLRAAGLTIADVDCVAFCGASDLDTDYGYDIPLPADDGSRFPATAGTRLLSSDCFRQTTIRVLGRDLPGVIVEHHVAHAACSFYTSGFSRSLVLAFDGLGDFGRSCLILRGSATRLSCMSRFRCVSAWRSRRRAPISIACLGRVLTQPAS